MDVRGIDSSSPLFGSEATPSPTPAASADAGPGQVSFGDVLLNAVEDASRQDSAAAKKAEALAAGAIDDLHGTMISLKEADITVKLVGSVRNKILDAFQELWRTSV